MDEADLKQVDDLIRERVRELLKSMSEAAGWYASGYDDHTESAAHLVRNVIEGTVRDLTPEPEPAPNPFAPKNTSQSWANSIRDLIASAESDGQEVWVDIENYGGPGPLIRIGPPDSIGTDDPIIWGEK